MMTPFDMFDRYKLNIGESITITQTARDRIFEKIDNTRLKQIIIEKIDNDLYAIQNSMMNKKQIAEFVFNFFAVHE